MAAASAVGSLCDRVEQAWLAGCDGLLVCNQPEAVDRLLGQWQPAPRQDWRSMVSLKAQQYGDWSVIERNPERLRIKAELTG